MKHCLIVDDSDLIRKVVHRLLEPMNFEISEAPDGPSAIAACAERVPDVILVDSVMPAMSGVEFLGALRAAKHDRRPYIIYCTTENDPEEMARAREAGASEILLKPFDRAELAAKLARADLP